MDIENILISVASIHNQLMEVSVRGDDVVRMSKIIQECRILANQLKSALNTNLDGEGKSED